MALAKCNSGILNLGLPGCDAIEKVIKKLVFVNLVASDGTVNKIDPATTLDKAWLDARLNNTDKTKKFFPTPELKNVDTPKGDPKYETYKDDSKRFVREGVRTITALLPGCPPTYKGKLESVRNNSKIGVYLVDIENNWTGLQSNSDGYMYPIEINAQSMNAKVVMANDDGTQQIDLMLEFPSTMKDENMVSIPYATFTGFLLSDISGLLDASYKLVGSVGATSFVVDISTPSPEFGQTIAVPGLVTADFISSVTLATSKIRDTTSSADVTITAAESATIPGRYTITYSTLSAKTLQFYAKKNGLDFTGFLTGAALVTP